MTSDRLGPGKAQDVPETSHTSQSAQFTADMWTEPGSPCEDSVSTLQSTRVAVDYSMSHAKCL